MRLALAVCILALAAWGVLRAQRPFKEYEGSEYNDFPLPPDYLNKTEWTRARLKYPSVYGQYYRGSGRTIRDIRRSGRRWRTASR